jgi:ABC-type oligopeptide transport system substrate-binding subunit
MNKRVWLSVVALAIGASLLVAAGFASPASSKTSAPAKNGAKGGTLQIDLTSDFDFIDPALSYFSHGWQMEYATNCKLLSFPDKEANAGGTKVSPEVATALPAVSRDGKTYTFTLKSTYKFADGSPVTAANFAYAMNRDLQPKMVSPAIDFMTDIKGAQAVIDGKAQTASGIKAISKTKLRITLTKVAPDFLARITMPFFSAVKTDTPINADGVSAPSKGTSCGPYYVSEWTTKRTATLSRNTFYKGGRPANPDQIHYNIGIALAAEELRVKNAETDFGGFPTADAAGLYNDFYVALGKKLNTGSKPSFVLRHQATFWYLNMNQDEPLFKNNNKLRQAVNWAIDRPQMVRQHGAKAGVVTSQILPYGFPGHNAKAVYPVVASKSPNVAKAKSLATSSVLRGGNCRLWTFNTSFGPAVAQVVQFNLKQIDLNCQITPLDRVVETTKGGNRDTNDFDILVNGWGQDYPDPYDFINILLDGNGIKPDNNVNLSYFNDASFNKRMEAAAKLSGAARYAAYAKLDHDLMAGPAPMAPYINTNARIFMSKRVGCYVYSQTYGSILNAACIS